MSEEFDLTEELREAPDDATDVLERFQRKYRRLYAALHFSLVMVILIVGAVWLKNWVYAAAIYIAGRLLLPKALELFSSMGDYETDSRVVGTGEHLRVIFGHFTEHYGIFSALRDLLIYGIAVLLGTGFVLSLLPSTVGTPLLISAIVLAVFYILLFPLVEDVVQFFSEVDKKEALDNIKLTISGIIVVLGLIATIVYPTYVAIAATANLDVNEALADYYEKLGDPDPYANIDLSDAQVDYSDLRAKCTFDYTGELDLGYGYSYGGAEMLMHYNVGKGKWQVVSYEYTDTPSINKQITYTGEGQFMAKDFEGLVELHLTLNPGAIEGSSGVVSIVDKASGKEVYASSFTIEAYSSLEQGYPMLLETPFPMQYFSVARFHFSLDKELKDIKINAAGGKLDLVLSE